MLLAHPQLLNRCSELLNRPFHLLKGEMGSQITSPEKEKGWERCSQSAKWLAPLLKRNELDKLRPCGLQVADRGC